MFAKTKRRLVTFLSVVFMATLALLGSTFLPNTYSAKAAVAAPQNLKVDALGYLRWDAVENADGYEWSYSTDGGVSYSTAEVCEGTEADISAAVSEAVKVAKTNGATNATLKLKVKAAGGAESQFDYTFDKYINYGYTTHDITDTYAPAKDGITGNFQAHSALYMNELMTFSVTLSSFLKEDNSGKTDFFIGFLSGDAVEIIPNTANYFYRLRFEAHGWTKIYRKGTIIFNQDISAFDMVADQPSYFAVGAFDTYNVSDGSVAGETVYLRRTDIINGQPVVVYASGITTGKLGNNPNQTFSTTEESADRPGHLPNAKNHTTVNNSTATTSTTDANRTGTVPKDTFAFYSGTDSKVKTSSGKIPTFSDVAAPTMTYYDNIRGQVRWNRVEGATGYEWTYLGSKDGWQETVAEYISAEDVKTALQAAKPNGNIRFAVRAVNGNDKSQTEYLGLDLTAFYGERATLKDISEINTRFKDPSHDALIDPLRNDGVSGYSYHNTGYGENTFVEHSFIFETNDNITNRIMISLHAEKWMSASGYVLSIYSSGDITICKSSEQPATKNNHFWARPKAVAFEIGQKYVATYGVEPLFNANGEKVADRVSMRISEVEKDGYRKLLTIVSFDNYEWDLAGVSIPTYPTYSTVINYNLYGSDNFKATTKILCVTTDREYTIMPIINGKALTSQAQTVKYGQAYDFTFVLETKGYDFENVQWKYKLTADSEEKDFYLKGYWNIDFNNENGYVGTFYTQADLINYNVNYVIPNSVQGVVNTANPETYTVEDEIALNAPQVPQGYVFKGWYKNLEDGVYSEQVETIEESYGDITLYARIVEGYDICVTIDDGETTKYAVDADSENFTLPNASSVYGKEFIGWYVKNGNTFEAYTGELSFKPTSNIEFWAKYEYKTYNVTYNAFGGEHNNATTYSIENVLIFTPAEKENYFFIGWYETSDFSGARVTDTDGLTKDITLYAKYVADQVSRTITYSLSEKMQRLPIPELPFGATYIAKLYETGKAEELDLIDGNAYVFDKEGSYTLKYYITLESGAELEREVVIEVKEAKITVDGTYKAEYNAGDELVILDGYMPDGSKAIVELKKDGKVITIDGNKLVLEVGKYEITYKDEAGIISPVAVSFEVVENAKWYENLVGGCKSSFGAGVGVIAAMMTMAGLVVLKKKDD